MKNIQVQFSNGEIVTAELISAFELLSLGKKYVFYTRNEVVENNLVKMYVAEITNTESPLILGDSMTDDEWTSLKNVMRAILTDTTDQNISYLEVGGN